MKVLLLFLLSLFSLLSPTNAAERLQETSRRNPLFEEVSKSFSLIPNSHLLFPTDIPLNISIPNYRFYSAYGVAFPKDFAIGPHIDYQCSLCDGDFKAIMIPRWLDPKMAKVCDSESNECTGANEKGFVEVDVCRQHHTFPGVPDRVQINLYFSNSTSCKPLGVFDEFDCEAENYGNEDISYRFGCTTKNVYLAPLVQQRDILWDVCFDE